MASEYSGMVSKFNSIYQEEVNDFENGLLLSAATLLFYIAGSVATFLRFEYNIRYSFCIDAFAILALAVALYLGKDMILAKGEED